MDPDLEAIRTIRDQLRAICVLSDRQGADMLTYLIEMSTLEAEDILGGRRALSSRCPARPSAASWPASI